MLTQFHWQRVWSRKVCSFGCCFRWTSRFQLEELKKFNKKKRPFSNGGGENKNRFGGAMSSQWSFHKMLLKFGFLFCTLLYVKFDSFSRANVFVLECRFPTFAETEKGLRRRILDVLLRKDFPRSVDSFFAGQCSFSLELASNRKKRIRREEYDRSSRRPTIVK